MRLLIVASLFIAIGTRFLCAQDQLVVTADELSRWCHYLAGDEMKGRKNGSPEMKSAAEFIAKGFNESGLAPAPGLNGYFQEYSIERRNTLIGERNVIGIIEGSDPDLKSEWIILSAHFDHVGTGKPVNGDSIYNGADDNAAGTVTLMALAKLLGNSPHRLKRSVLFAAFSGEEVGIRGSKHFLQNCPIPVDRIRLNLNFEMTGEFKTLGENLFILTGYKFTDFDDLVKEYSKTEKWQMAEKMRSPDWTFFASDNASFAITGSGDQMRLNIPAFTIVTTDDLNIIHKPSDEPQFLDYENMASLVDYLQGLIIFLSGNELDINWDEEAFRRFLER